MSCCHRLLSLGARPGPNGLQALSSPCLGPKGVLYSEGTWRGAGCRVQGPGSRSLRSRVSDSQNKLIIIKKFIYIAPAHTSICLLCVRRFVEGKIGRKREHGFVKSLLKKAFVFNLLCILVCFL